MTKLIIFLALLVSASSLGGAYWYVSAQEDDASYSSGTLIPGGSFTGVDGVTVDASLVEGGFELAVFIERLVKDKLGVSPPRFGTPVTHYYRIGASPEYETRSKTLFLIRIPLPEGVDTAGLGAPILAPPKSLTDIQLPEGTPGIWLPSWADYVSETHEAQLTLSSIPPKGLIIGIAEGVY